MKIYIAPFPIGSKRRPLALSAMLLHIETRTNTYTTTVSRVAWRTVSSVLGDRYHTRTHKAVRKLIEPTSNLKSGRNSLYGYIWDYKGCNNYQILRKKEGGGSVVEKIFGILLSAQPWFEPRTPGSKNSYAWLRNLSLPTPYRWTTETAQRCTKINQRIGTFLCFAHLDKDSKNRNVDYFCK